MKKNYISPKMRACNIQMDRQCCLLGTSNTPDKNVENQFTNEDFGWDDEEDGINWKW